MPENGSMIRVFYRNSGEESQIPLNELVSALTGFLDHFGEPKLLGDEIYKITQSGDGAAKFTRLLAACGYPDDPRGFFYELAELIGKADGSLKIAVGGVELPHLLLMAVMAGDAARQ